MEGWGLAAAEAQASAAARSPEERLLDIFAGRDDAYGVYTIDPSAPGAKKKGQAQTLRGAVTASLWGEHLAGGRAIGIIPIRADAACQWGAIDVDTYPIDLGAIVQKLDALQLPGVVCRSKSGGAHILFFLREPIPAGDVQDKLEEIAAALGFGGCEVFPKQRSLASESDVGNWLNMPYAGPRSMRYALGIDGQALSLEDFLTLAEASRLDPSAFRSLAPAQPQSIVVDGPPCLERLVTDGFPAGTRNNGLFSLGVYFRQSQPDDWDESLRKFAAGMVPPKEPSEVEAIIKSLDRKDYFYKCNDTPLRPHCNRSLCLTRRFGVGPGGEARISSLSKLDSHPPLWFLDVDGTRVQLTSAQLQSQSRFAMAVMESCHKVPPPMKAPQWTAKLNELLEHLTIIEVPPEASSGGAFEELVEEFCTNRFQARNEEEILLGKPFLDGERHLFRLQDLTRFLRDLRFDELSRIEVVARLRDLGGESKQLKIGRRNMRVWSLPRFEAPNVVPLPTLSEDAF